MIDIRGNIYEQRDDTGPLFIVDGKAVWSDDWDRHQLTEEEGKALTITFAKPTWPKKDARETP